MAKEAAHTLDAFHRGRFWLVQPRQTGHRAGADALILAAAVPSAFSGRLADFGAGAGGAALAVAARCPGAEVQLVEQSPEMADFARQTLEHPKNAGLAARASLLVADVGLAGAAREKAGLAARSFDFVIMNPPFNGPADRSSPDALRRQAHVMDDGLFAAWLKSAAAVLRPRGSVAIIARPPAIAPILAAMNGRFGAADIVPVHARADAAAIRVVIRARLGSRAALSMMPPLVLHEASGNAFSARAEAIFAGEAALFGD
jgi:tRNA1(Val) A37 N6-methylase TrmN6